MGFQSARLIHDLKGLTSAPRTYAEIIRKRLGGELEPVLEEALSSLSHDLENLNRVILELNQLNIIRSQDNFTHFAFEDIFKAVRLLLGNRLSYVILENDVNVQLNSDQSVLTSIVLNVVINAIENYKLVPDREPKISFRQTANRIVISDNGGGFDPKVLSALESQQSVTQKLTGSGLGLWMVRDGMQSIGGTAFFGNDENGAVVTLQFPKKSLQSGIRV